jgi:hypothetical protein
MPTGYKNSIPTSFTVDLSTIDRKIDKLIKYFKNCDIDLQNHQSNSKYGLTFVNKNVTYKELIKSFENKNYKSNLASMIGSIYSTRSERIINQLKENKIARDDDFALLNLTGKPIDDFGSQFDVFAASNTDPNNLVLKFLDIIPYKTLKVDILSEQDYAVYSNSLSASYEFDKYSFLLNKLNNITSNYLSLAWAPESEYYKNEIFTEFQNGGLPVEELLSSSENLQSITTDDIRKYSDETFNFLQDQKFVDALRQVDIKLFDNLKNNNISNDDLQRGRIKVVNYYLSNILQKLCDNSLAKTTNLEEFKSEYPSYDFLNEQFAGQTIAVRDINNDGIFNNDEVESSRNKKNELYYKLTFYKQDPKLITREKKKILSPSQIEFNSSKRITFGSPLGSDPDIRNNKFVAIISSDDLLSTSLIDFFEPTILSILSDIDFIDFHIKEIDWSACPTPGSLDPNINISKQKYVDNQVIVDSFPWNKNKFLVQSDGFFDYYNFPDLYFIPNELLGPSAFYEESQIKILPSREQASQILKKHAKFEYDCNEPTSMVSISRDENATKFFDNLARQNGFYGFFEKSKDSFSDPIFIQQIINKLNGMEKTASEKINGLIFAKTNIACLLSEFQSCFLPKTTSCKDVLRSFRFSELEEIVKRSFPETAYPGIFDTIARVKSDAIKNQREAQLVAEIKNLEENLKDNRRRFVIFEQLDLRVEPGEALKEADRRMGAADTDLTLEQQLQQKLREYKDLKTSQELLTGEQQKQNENLQMIDDLLNKLETEHGINTDILCDLAAMVKDLLNISWNFGSITLPELPTIDIFYDLKLSIDLSLIQLILDSVVAFVLKILEQLLTCGGWKDLLNAAVGELTSLMTDNTSGLIEQLQNGDFDLDQFIDNNPSIDPEIFYSNINSALKTYSPGIIKTTETTRVKATIELPFSKATVVSKRRTLDLLSDQKFANDQSNFEQETYIKFTGLLSQLSGLMDRQDFINLIGGKPTEQSLKFVSNYIINNFENLIFLSPPKVLKTIFTYLSEISGLNNSREEISAVAVAYSSKIIKRDENKNVFCEVPDIRDVTAPVIEPILITAPTNPYDQEYASIISDLLSASPDKIKQEVDDKIFKPILIGMLPNGNNIPAVDQSNKRLIKRSLKSSSEKFKRAINGFYNNLSLKKPYERKVYEKIVQSNGSSTTNQEYTDIINKGGWEQQSQPSSDSSGSGSFVVKTETKYVAAGIFKENFKNIDNKLLITNNNQLFSISLEGKYTYSSKEIQNFYNSDRILNNSWKIINQQDGERNIYKILEGNSNSNLPTQYQEKFIYTVNNQQNFENNYISFKDRYKNILKESILQAAELSPTDSTLQSYVSNTYDNFLSSILQLIVEQILQDNLLKEVPSAESQDIMVQFRESILSALGGSATSEDQLSKLGLESPYVDNAMKYINFHPKQTEQQKRLDVEPNLYGTTEITKLILRLMNKRDSETINLKSLQEILADEDNSLLLSIIDGLILSYIRVYCSELSMRSLFVLKTFKFDSKLLEDLLLPTYVAEKFFDHISLFSQIAVDNKNTFNMVMQQHTDHLHDYLFQQIISESQYQFLFEKINLLKKNNISMEIDKDILMRYKNKIDNRRNAINEEYQQKLTSFIDCLEQEINKNKIEILKLQLRNIAFNEFSTIFDKLSYITSTNERVVEGLGEQCSTAQIENESEFLDQLVIDSLFDKKLFDIQDIGTEDEDLYVDYLELQNKKFVQENSFIAEKYVYVPEIKSEYSSTVLANIQRQQNAFGFVSIRKFKKFITSVFNSLEQVARNISVNKYFSGDIKFGTRIVFIKKINPEQQSIDLYVPGITSQQSSLWTAVEYLKNTGKNKIFLSSNSGVQQYNIKLDPLDGRPINLKEMTYSIPFLIEETFERDGTQKQPKKIGMINAFPIFDKKLSLFAEGHTTYQSLFNIIDQFEDNSSQIITKMKQEILCDEEFTDIYELYTNKNLLSNILILSSIYTLGSTQIREPFEEVKNSILNDIIVKINSINNRFDQEEFYEKLASKEYWNVFNAGLITKVIARAAVQVLQYYCYTTDPNISTAMLIRQAVQISVGLASQVSSQLGSQALPPQLPYPFNSLLPYSMGQLPVNIFGVPPVGVGIGPPITIPGLILLGAEIILLDMDWILEDNSQSDRLIKEQIKRLCLDLDGYKKYGIE